MNATTPVNDRNSCFGLHLRLSDYLDEKVASSEKATIDRHLKDCSKCAERMEHYAVIREKISAPHFGITPSSKEAASNAADLLKSLEESKKRSWVSRERWARAPWYIRTGAETFGVSALILLVIVIGPRLRTFYEKSMERRLESFDLAEVSTVVVPGEPEIGSADDSLEPESPDTEAETLDDRASDWFSSSPDITSSHEVPREKTTDWESLLAQLSSNPPLPSTDEDTTSQLSAESVPNPSTLKIGSSEIWRFYVKTDSPKELRPRIQALLEDLKIAEQLPPVDRAALSGIEAPGGIQFNFLAPVTAVPELMTKMQQLSSTLSVPDTQEAQTRQTFTWYKSKSKKTIPAGQARVVIWLSQI